MTGALLLQIFLYVNIFAIGALAVLAIQHAHAHFRPDAHKETQPTPEPEAALPQAVKRRLLRAAETQYQTILDRSAADLQHSLQATSIDLTKQLNKLGSEIVHDELQRYKQTIDQLRQKAEEGLGGAQDEITAHQAELKAKLDERHKELEAKLEEQHQQRVADLQARLEAEQQQVISQIDTKLADAVASFLTETLQHEVDLGAQTAYMTAMLEEHKAELVKKVSNEA